MPNFKLTDVVAFASAIAFLASVAYLSGFAISLGTNISPYIDLHDYLQVAIQWLPGCIALMALGILIEGFLVRVERGKSEDQIIAESSTPKFARKNRQASEKFLGLVAISLGPLTSILSIFTLVPKERLYSAWEISGPAVWFFVTIWYLREPNLTRNWTKETAALVLLAPAFLLFAFTNGLLKGATGNGVAGYSGVEVSLRGVPQSLNGQLIFLSDGFLILRSNVSRKVFAVPRSEITLITNASLPK